jgi:hypothetical protein
MFCGNLPCTCNAKPAKAARAPKPVPVAPELPRVDRRAAMKTAATEMPVQKPTAQESVDDETASALIVLDAYDMLAENEKQRFDAVFKDTGLRARLWKERRSS